MKLNQTAIVTRPSNLELSIFTLWSLFILIDQHFKALVKYRGLLDVEFKLEDENEIYLCTIYEALLHQIFMKVCAFIDEWDKFLGVKTDVEYHDKIKQIKRIGNPARKLIDKWTGLREYRNQAIAHNHRDKNGNNIYFMKKFFYKPESLAEISLMIYCVEKMAKIIGAVLYDEFQRAITKPFQTGYEFDKSNFKHYSRGEIIEIIDSIDKKTMEGFKKISSHVIDVTSDYGDFLRVAP